MIQLRDIELIDIGTRLLLRRDPTRSSPVRRAGRSQVNARVYALNKGLRQNIQEQDNIGLRKPDYVSWVEPIAGKLERSEQMVRYLVEQTLATPPDWLRGLIENAIRRGVNQAGSEIKAAVDNIDTRELNQFHTATSVVEVKGIAGETQRRVLRHIAAALEQQQSPNELMRELRMTLEKVTRARLILLVNTIMVKAVNAGKLHTYKLNGVSKVGIEPEWNPAGFTRRAHDHGKWKDADVNVLTAGDDLVCDECEDIADDGPYTLEEAAGLIPAHISCRCTFVPLRDEDDFEELVQEERELRREEEEETIKRLRRNREDE